MIFSIVAGDSSLAPRLATPAITSTHITLIVQIKLLIKLSSNIDSWKIRATDNNSSIPSEHSFGRKAIVLDRLLNKHPNVAFPCLRL